ncbi:hypothetical protein CIB84_017159 [Bambusicola thoracicus]|uniref:Uncharacterized protein n=1 Tax=Bambusicola thoracicus TaxID=9083 RepID=A0A2P4S4Q2_BAMTH|nr:hypothetical protein CIB84_017159 [Bambusicola thoracicus]
MRTRTDAGGRSECPTQRCS